MQARRKGRAREKDLQGRDGGENRGGKGNESKECAGEGYMMDEHVGRVRALGVQFTYLHSLGQRSGASTPLDRAEAQIPLGQ